METAGLLKGTSGSDHGEGPPGNSCRTGLRGAWERRLGSDGLGSLRIHDRDVRLCGAPNLLGGGGVHER